MTDEIDSWPKKGDRMVFTNAGGWPHEQKRAEGVFKLGEVYEVKGCDVHDWTHYVYFEGVQGGWNGCMFDLVEKEPGAMIPIVLEGVVKPKVEDGGQAQIAEIGGESDDYADGESGMFVRIQSWCEGGKHHPEMDAIRGKRVRVTIEVVE